MKMKPKTIQLLFVFFLLFAFGSVAMAVGNNDWEGYVDSDYSDQSNWLIAAGTNPPSGFESNRGYADYTRWITNYRPGDTPVGSITNSCIIDGTLLAERTRMMGGHHLVIANGGTLDCLAFQIGSYGGPGEMTVQTGGTFLCNVGTVENCYIGNFASDRDGVLNVDGGTVMIDLNGYDLNLESYRDYNPGQIVGVESDYQQNHGTKAVSISMHTYLL
jgi:hypothetical protein